MLAYFDICLSSRLRVLQLQLFDGQPPATTNGVVDSTSSGGVTVDEELHLWQSLNYAAIVII